VVLVLDFGLQLRHVDAGRAVALAAFAADTEVEHLLVEPVAVDLVLREVAGDGGPEHVRPAARRLYLLL
jgi:hypothetical protein